MTPATGGRRIKPHALELADGGRLVLGADGSIDHIDGHGSRVHRWKLDDPEWPDNRRSGSGCSPRPPRPHRGVPSRARDHRAGSPLSDGAQTYAGTVGRREGVTHGNLAPARRSAGTKSRPSEPARGTIPMRAVIDWPLTMNVMKKGLPN